jgi:hypothetical protein
MDLHVGYKSVQSINQSKHISTHDYRMVGAGIWLE